MQPNDVITRFRAVKAANLARVWLDAGGTAESAGNATRAQKTLAARIADGNAYRDGYTPSDDTWNVVIALLNHRGD